MIQVPSPVVGKRISLLKLLGTDFQKSGDSLRLSGQEHNTYLGLTAATTTLTDEHLEESSSLLGCGRHIQVNLKFRCSEIFDEFSGAACQVLSRSALPFFNQVYHQYLPPKIAWTAHTAAATDAGV